MSFPDSMGDQSRKNSMLAGHSSFAVEPGSSRNASAAQVDSDNKQLNLQEVQQVPGGRPEADAVQKLQFCGLLWQQPSDAWVAAIREPTLQMRLLPGTYGREAGQAVIQGSGIAVVYVCSEVAVHVYSAPASKDTHAGTTNGDFGESSTRNLGSHASFQTHQPGLHNNPTTMMTDMALAVNARAVGPVFNALSSSSAQNISTTNESGTVMENGYLGNADHAIKVESDNQQVPGRGSNNGWKKVAIEKLQYCGRVWRDESGAWEAAIQEPSSMRFLPGKYDEKAKAIAAIHKSGIAVVFAYGQVEAVDAFSDLAFKDTHAVNTNGDQLGLYKNSISILSGVAVATIVEFMGSVMSDTLSSSSTSSSSSWVVYVMVFGVAIGLPLTMLGSLTGKKEWSTHISKIGIIAIALPIIISFALHLPAVKAWIFGSLAYLILIAAVALPDRFGKFFSGW